MVNRVPYETNMGYSLCWDKKTLDSFTMSPNDSRSDLQRLTISKVMYKRNRPGEYRFNQAVFLIPSSLSRIRVLSIAW